uniref:Uncharacterized protein n=1 Tax=Meloidogyne incognita TaxID=6306 RepID=A0A914LRL0_MELIC
MVNKDGQKNKIFVFRKYPKRYGRIKGFVPPKIVKCSNFCGFFYKLSDFDVIYTTLDHAYNFHTFKDVCPDMVFFEESSQICFVEAVSLLGRFVNTAQGCTKPFS